ILYRDVRLWLIQVITLAFGIGAMIATMKLLYIHLNLLNVLSFRLVLAIGVDYGIYVVLVWQKTQDIQHDLAGVVKPVLLAGLTAISGFGSLALARNPALTGLGIACAIGAKAGVLSTRPPLAVVYLDRNFSRPASLPLKEVAQKDLTFLPALLPIEMGTRVAFSNLDDTYHNIFSYSPTKRFDLGRYR